MGRFGLDRTSFPEFLAGVERYEPDPEDQQPRAYPGYPRVELPGVRARFWPPLDRVLAARRCIRTLTTRLPSRSRLARLLKISHGVFASENRGPCPSAGGLQAVELYLTPLGDSWLPAGFHHYDRAGHHLSLVAGAVDAAALSAAVPSLADITGGALVWFIVGDGERVQRKYGERAYPFLWMEAGHLMQNLCLVSASLGLCTVPLGGYLEPDVAGLLRLPASDAVLYAGVLG
ncbi:MAG: SagB/ThcOx family dehydrogenase [Candidatus Riflebacteria bacterium]|nr:SagB/ThcOx family dehydrogenase [Candidatus Riflebacteria bacterium]